MVGECAGYVAAIRGVGGKWTCGEKSGPQDVKGSTGDLNGDESRLRIGWGRRERSEDMGAMSGERGGRGGRVVVGLGYSPGCLRSERRSRSEKRTVAQGTRSERGHGEVDDAEESVRDEEDKLERMSLSVAALSEPHRAADAWFYK